MLLPRLDAVAVDVEAGASFSEEKEKKLKKIESFLIYNRESFALHSTENTNTL